MANGNGNVLELMRRNNKQAVGDMEEAEKHLSEENIPGHPDGKCAAIATLSSQRKGIAQALMNQEFILERIIPWSKGSEKGIISINLGKNIKKMSGPSPKKE